MPTEMSLSKQRSASNKRDRNLLLARAGVVRTFGSLGSFLAIIFLGAGIYLLQDTFTDPLRAQGIGLTAGAFIIALATILIYFVFAPRKKYRAAKERRSNRVHTPVNSLVISVAANVPEKGEKDLAMHA